jgi:hypothetical protein
VRKNIAVHHDSELGEYKMIMKELGTTIEPRINYQRLTPILGHFWPKIPVVFGRKNAEGEKG